MASESAVDQPRVSEHVAHHGRRQAAFFGENGSSDGGITRSRAGSIQPGAYSLRVKM